ncbi:MAG: glutamate-5-semialdehyde dehydrogenase [Eubacteriales bacterium]|nr:glutamate-5-semialdehyde dehydrogenase [Eubacteriales bacterium]
MDTTVDKAAFGARRASYSMRALSSEAKNKALIRIAEALEMNRDIIEEANITDIERSKIEGLAYPLLKRLEFSGVKLDAAIKGIREMAELPDPVGSTTYQCDLDEGLELYRVTCPLGVIGVIFESRPDALVQISALCLKSSNAVILKGGSEADNTNKVLTGIISDAACEMDIPNGWITLLRTRSDVGELLKQDRNVDLIIPRGSNDFVSMIMKNTNIPVLGHADGVCHVYIDKYADPEIAVRVVIDGKTQYPAVCNAVETVLVHKDAASLVLPLLDKAFNENNVQVYGCEKTAEKLGCQLVSDWHTEYLDLKVSLKIVGSIDDATDHINTYGSGHTESIVTNDRRSAELFMSVVDSGNVFWNCSTRFSDGYRYGFGAEVGVSTSKVHARGPVGLDGLVTYKYKLFGNGNIVGDYSSGKKDFDHIKGNKACPFDR